MSVGLRVINYRELMSVGENVVPFRHTSEAISAICADRLASFREDQKLRALSCETAPAAPCQKSRTPKTSGGYHD